MDENSEQVKSDIKTLRFITPICKSFGCKIGIQAISECMEALGGQGYMEDVGIARAVRDAQVNTIWEGTTNVLGLDVLRVLKETKGEALLHFKEVRLIIHFATQYRPLVNINNANAQSCYRSFWIKFPVIRKCLYWRMPQKLSPLQ
jgi:hypothetical protein